MEKDCKSVSVELTPAWWKDKELTFDGFIVIPDTEYDNPTKGIDYGKGQGSDTDYLTGVIVKAPQGHDRFLGRWCHYMPHGPHMFHPFRKRFSNGKTEPIESKVAKRVKLDDMIVITEIKIF